MKKLGLIGGTGPESTLVYYKEINRRFNEKCGGKAFPELAIESVDLIKALNLVKNEKYDELASYLSERLKNLEKGGAEVVALTAATMHVVFEKLQEFVEVPFISIPEAASEYAVCKGYKKVGLLGTIFTMEKDYLSKAFLQKGIEAVILGCTELPLALNKNNCPVEPLDIMDIHIDKLVEMIGE